MPQSTSLPPLLGPEIEPLLTLDHDLLVRTELGLSREWLETDGRGGYAMGTAVDLPTRRHHGLLCCVPDGSDERHLFLQRFDEQLCGMGRSFPVGMGRYGSQYSPERPLALVSFRLVPYPCWTYRFGLVELQREVLTVRGERTTLVRWTVRGPREGLALMTKPLLPFRAAGALTMENMQLDPTVGRVDGGLEFEPYRGLPKLTLSASVGERGFDLGAAFEADPVWYRNISYLAEELRGEAATEEQFSPGWMNLPLEPDQPFTMACSIDGAVEDPAAMWAEEQERRELELARDLAHGNAIEHGASAFLFRDEDGALGLLAGFPWLGQSARDAFLALPGLTLARGDAQACREVLERALAHARDGLLPSELGGRVGRGRYEPTDAGLWFALAADRYAAAKGADAAFVGGALRSGLEAYAEALLAGRAPGLKVAENGLLNNAHGAGTDWMDARVDGLEVTPRPGFAVEQNALWYALLDQLAELASDAGDAQGERRWSGLARAVGLSFKDSLWRENARFLLDSNAPERECADVRCNAIVAAALARSPLEAQQRADVVQRVSLELKTPTGLRTLAPKNAAYEGHYRGGPLKRNAAQHQGSVAVWPIGYYVEASLAAEPGRAAELGALLEGLAEHLQVHGLGHVSELFDGDPPHRPGGAPMHAAGLGELLRARAAVAHALQSEGAQ